MRHRGSCVRGKISYRKRFLTYIHMKRPKTSVGRGLPGLRGTPKSERRQITGEDINNLKVRILEMESERRLLRAKIQRMRKTIQNRNEVIRKVLKQPYKDKSIRTASDATLQQLREEKATLLNTIDGQREELAAIKGSDKFALTQELKVEIPLFHQERARLQEKTAKSREVELSTSREVERLNRQIATIDENERLVDDLQHEIDDLTEKLFAYRKSEIRIAAAGDLQVLHDNPSSYDDITQRIEDEIHEIQQSIQRDNLAIEKIQKEENDHIAYLNQIIDRQVEVIRKAAEGQAPKALAQL